MLKELTIKNFAIIEDLNISFNNGMSVFLGETGAGKSIIIDAFSLLLGNRASISKIRSGQSKAFVEALIEIDNIDDDLLEYKDETNLFTFTRIINSEGNSICKINGLTVNMNILKNTLGKRVNLHSQHDLFYLLDPKFHLELLDKFGGRDLINLKNKYLQEYNVYTSQLDKYKQLINNNKNEDIDYLKYQLKEIEEIDLQENEIEELELEASRITKYNKLNTNISATINLLDETKGVNELLYDAKRYMSNISDDPLFSEFEERLMELYENSKNITSDIKQAFNSLNIDESRLAYIEERMYKINKLKRKYGNTYLEIDTAKKDFINRIELVENREFIIDKLDKEIKEQYSKIEKLALELSSFRKKVANELEKNILLELKDLYLDKTIFKVQFNLVELSNTGADKVEFMIATNIGENLKPLQVVASGGETSRITLALNVVFNKVFDISLAIFDEVDTGVSGKIATSMGNKIKQLSNSYQTIVISHLPQVISKSDYFYYVYKEVIDNKTKSFVKLLNEEERIIEIAKILSGSDNPSSTFIENAKELIK